MAGGGGSGAAGAPQPAASQRPATAAALVPARPSFKRSPFLAPSLLPSTPRHRRGAANAASGLAAPWALAAAPNSRSTAADYRSLERPAQPAPPRQLSGRSADAHGNAQQRLASPGRGGASAGQINPFPGAGSGCCERRANRGRAAGSGSHRLTAAVGAEGAAARVSRGVSGLIVRNMERFVSAVISIDVTTEILIKISCQNESSRVEYRSCSAFPLPPASAHGGLSFLLTKYLCSSGLGHGAAPQTRCVLTPGLCPRAAVQRGCSGWTVREAAV